MVYPQLYDCFDEVVADSDRDELSVGPSYNFYGTAQLPAFVLAVASFQFSQVVAAQTHQCLYVVGAFLQLGHRLLELDPDSLVLLIPVQLEFDWGGYRALELLPVHIDKVRG